MNSDLIEIIFPNTTVSTSRKYPFSVEGKISDAITVGASELNSGRAMSVL